MPYKEQNKIFNKEYIKGLRARTYCLKCGGQPIEWHRKEHKQNNNLQIAHLVALGFPIERIEAEIALCTPLCRSCHMKEDGRLEAFRQNCPYKKGVKEPAKQCRICGKFAKPLRKGRCNRCNWRYRLGKGS